MTHAEERARERCADAGIDWTKLYSFARAIAPRLSGDCAVLLADLGVQVNQAWSDRSNGDQLWAIVREGSLTTMMLRRSTQPPTPDALRVQRVHDARRYIK